MFLMYMVGTCSQRVEILFFIILQLDSMYLNEKVVKMLEMSDILFSIQQTLLYVSNFLVNVVILEIAN